ncbi:MAG: hypothetical protein AAFV53_26115, partial [Myxococcota bacterium]
IQIHRLILFPRTDRAQLPRRAQRVLKGAMTADKGNEALRKRLYGCWRLRAASKRQLTRRERKKAGLDQMTLP